MAQSPVDVVLQQLGACGTLLRAMRGRGAFSQLSAAEAERAGQALRTVALSPVDATRVVEAVTKAGFDPAHEGQLLDTLGEVLTCTQSKSAAPVMGRASSQSFENFVHYLPRSVQEKLKQGDVSPLIDLLVSLGLRNASEPTMCVATCFVLHQTEGFEKAMRMSPDVKLEFSRSLKSMLKAKAKLVPTAATLVSSLPADPAAFNSSFPALHAQAFGEEQPAESPVPEMEMQQLKLCTRMRALRGCMSLRSHQQGQWQVPAGLMQFGQCLAQQVQSLSADVQAMQNGICQTPPRASPRKSLSFQSLVSGSPALGSPASAPMLPWGDAGAQQAWGDAGAQQAPTAVAPEPQPPAPRLALEAPPVAAEGAEGSPAKPSKNPDDVAKALLQQLGKDAPRAKGEAKSKAKAKAPAKATASSKAKVEGNRCGGKGLVSKAIGKASKVAPEPRMPQPGQPHAPIHVGKVTIYMDRTASSWRCVHADNKRRDVKFSFKKDPKEAWRRCMDWVMEHV